jgi:hypothetical protein
MQKGEVMERNYRKLGLILKIFPANLWYVINIYESKIYLQGRYSSNLAKLISKYMKINCINENGYLIFIKEQTSGNIEIILT